MRMKWFINERNTIILLLGILLTGVFFIRYDNIIKPIVLTAMMLSFSVLYPIIFYSAGNVDNKLGSGLFANERVDEVNNVVHRINKSIRYIKSRTEDNSRLTIVSRFMDEINEFEDAIPELVEDYKRGLGFIQKNNTITKEILSLEKKVTIVKGTAREIYQKALNEKRSTLQEIENIKTYLDESESKLHYILSTLQKIEAIVEATEFEHELSDEDMGNLNTHLETFSESLKGVIHSMKL